MNNKHSTTIEINLPSPELAETVYLSLKPELNAKVGITVEECFLTLKIRADTIPSLRALANSYLRWVDVVCKISFLVSKFKE